MYTLRLNEFDYFTYDQLLRANHAPLPVEQCRVPASEIIENRLFFGNIYDAYYLNKKAHKYQTKRLYVLNIAATHPFLEHAYPGIHYLNIRDVEDGLNSIAPYFLPAIRFIETALADPNGVILVHCLAGMVRSATLIAAYLIYKDFIDKTLNDNVQRHYDTESAAYAAALHSYTNNMPISKNTESIASFVASKIALIKEKRAIIDIRANFIEELKAFTKILLNIDPQQFPAMLDYQLLLRGFNHPSLMWHNLATNSNCAIM